MTGAAAADRAKVLNIYAWSEYFPRQSRSSNPKPDPSTTQLDSPETAETILSVGSSNYDLVTMNAAPELAREILRLLGKLDRPVFNARNADPQILQLLKSVDPGNQYAVPWM